MIFSSISLFSQGNPFLRITDDIFQYIYVIVLLILSVCSLIVGIYLRKGTGWAWDCAILLSITWIILNIIVLILVNYGRNLDIFVLHIFFIYYLYRPHVMTYYEKRELTIYDIEKWKKDKIKIGNILTVLGIILFFTSFIPIILFGWYFFNSAIIIGVIGILMRTF